MSSEAMILWMYCRSLLSTTPSQLASHRTVLGLVPDSTPSRYSMSSSSMSSSSSALPYTHSLEDSLGNPSSSSCWPTVSPVSDCSASAWSFPFSALTYSSAADRTTSTATATTRARRAFIRRPPRTGSRGACLRRR